MGRTLDGAWGELHTCRLAVSVSKTISNSDMSERLTMTAVANCLCLYNHFVLIVDLILCVLHVCKLVHVITIAI